MNHCSYYLLRYVPNVATGQFVNVGVFLYWPRVQFLDCLFTDDFSDVRRLHPEADLDFLRELQSHFEQEIAEHEKDLAGYIRGIEESYSDLIQISEPHPCTIDDPQSALGRLLKTYVGRRAAGPPKLDTRMRIKRRLAEALKQRGLLDLEALQKDVPAAQWTGAGDTFTFDFSYRPFHPAGQLGPGLRLIHALSLLRNSELAEMLRSKFDKTLDKLPARLIVAHEDIADASNALVRSSQHALRGKRTLLVPLGSFQELALRVRQELGM